MPFSKGPSSVCMTELMCDSMLFFPTIQGIYTQNLVSGSDLPIISLLCILFLRNSQFYIQAIGDLNYLTYSRVRNVFHQSDTIYRLNSDGRWANRACKITHEHTGSVSLPVSSPFPGSAQINVYDPISIASPSDAPKIRRKHSCWVLP
jgi:hypothetical protein